jgi:hypothetical protein
MRKSNRSQQRFQSVKPSRAASTKLGRRRIDPRRYLLPAATLAAMSLVSSHALAGGGGGGPVLFQWVGTSTNASWSNTANWELESNSSHATPTLDSSAYITTLAGPALNITYDFASPVLDGLYIGCGTSSATNTAFDTLLISSGNLTVTGSPTGTGLEVLGDDAAAGHGNGAITQSGGTNTTNGLEIGVYTYGNGVTGQYNLSAGTLTATTEIISDYAAGFFDQTGGVNDAGALGLGASGGGNGFSVPTAGGYTLSAGTLAVTNGITDGTLETFTQSAGTTLTYNTFTQNGGTYSGILGNSINYIWQGGAFIAN